MVGMWLNCIFGGKGVGMINMLLYIIIGIFIAGMMVFFLIAAHLALNTFSPVVSSAILAEAIKPEVDAGDVIVINGPFENASALPFYLERQVKILNRQGILDAEGDGYVIRDGIVVIPRGSVLRDGTVI